MKNFALMGLGYIAPRHLKAIKDTGNTLVAFLNKHDSVGIIDSHFPDADFFTEFERFDRHIEKLKRAGANKRIDYVTVCTPNYLHDAHIRFGLRAGADVICEKPVVLNPWNIDALVACEKEFGHRVSTIMQLRLHTATKQLKEKFLGTKKKHDVTITYITPRGRWYHRSWKGHDEHSGGLTTNIGVHLFDLVTYLFGAVQNNTVHLNSPERAAGILELENARVRWFLSLSTNDLPKEVLAQKKNSYRQIDIDGSQADVSDGFTELHTLSYQEILAGRGFSLEDCRASIQTVHDIRHAETAKIQGDFHPFIKNT